MMTSTRKQRYPSLLTQKEIVRLLRHGIYAVCPTTAAVTGPSGEVVTPFDEHHEDGNRLFVRLYWNKKRKTISLARLAWMARTLQPVPPKFEIHHRNGVRYDNAFDNLLCVHKLDHDKLHCGDVPF